MTKKFVFRIFLSLVLAIVLEFCVFNFSTLQMKWNRSLQTNQIFTLADMEAINWTKEGDAYVSREDPQLVFETGGTQRIENVIVQFHTEPLVTSAQFFYTDEGGMVQAVTQSNIQSGRICFQVDAVAEKLLRIDLGDFAGTRLSDITVTLNAIDWHISASRIVAVALIYVCGSLLFRIQRMPDYHLDRKLEKKDERSGDGQP